MHHQYLRVNRVGKRGKTGELSPAFGRMISSWGCPKRRFWHVLLVILTLERAMSHGLIMPHAVTIQNTIL